MIKEKNIFFGILYVIKEYLLLEFGNVFIINISKIVFILKVYNWCVIGVILNIVGKLLLGRERKCYIKYFVYIYKIGKFEEEDILYLIGLLFYVKYIELLFI